MIGFICECYKCYEKKVLAHLIMRLIYSIVFFIISNICYVETSSNITTPNGTNEMNDTGQYMVACNLDIDTTTINIAYTGFLVVVILVNLFGNGLVCFVIGLSPALRSHTTNLFLFSLAMTDILLGLISLPIRIKQSLNNQLFCMPEWVCWFYYFTDTTISIASVTHLLVIAIDRFVAVQFTYIYETVLSKRRITIVIVLTWIYSLTWTCMNTFDWSNLGQRGVKYMEESYCITENQLYFTTLYVVIFLIPILVMAVMYSFVYHTVVRHIRSISKCQVSQERQSKARKRRAKELKALKAISIVFIAFCICWIPNIVVSLSGFWNPEYWRNLYFRNNNAFIATFFITGQILPPLNSTINPFIYAICNKQFRIGYKAVLWRLFGEEAQFKNWTKNRRMTAIFGQQRLSFRMKPRGDKATAAESHVECNQAALRMRSTTVVTTPL